MFRQSSRLFWCFKLFSYIVASQSTDIQKSGSNNNNNNNNRKHPVGLFWCTLISSSKAWRFRSASVSCSCSWGNSTCDSWEVSHLPWPWKKRRGWLTSWGPHGFIILNVTLHFVTLIFSRIGLMIVKQHIYGQTQHGEMLATDPTTRSPLLEAFLQRCPTLGTSSHGGTLP